MCTCCEEELDSECDSTETEVKHTLIEKSGIKQEPLITRLDLERLKGDKLFQQQEGEPNSALHLPGMNLKQRIANPRT